MTRTDHGDETTERRLGLWISEIPETLRELRGDILDEDFPFDFGTASLAGLEAHLLAEYRSADEKPDLDFRPTRCAAVYLGEVLLDVAGGRWGWQPRGATGSSAGRPVVHPDPALGLAPVSPLALVARAVRTRTGSVFTEEAARLAEAVAGLRRREPDWAPAVVPRPGQADRTAGADHPELLRWLAVRSREFARWANDAGPAGDDGRHWDFSPASLDVLETVLRERFDGGAGLLGAKSGAFVQGAVWYLGEVVRRARDGVVWQYQPRTRFDEPLEAAMFHAPDEIYLDTPRVGQPGLREGGSAHPMAVLNVFFWQTDELDNPIEPRLADILDDLA
ncbi:hypothetical protein P1S61_13465 [Streptomyces sp. ME08-AFT2]|uniref:hypothetical protein n=1 Tax=Streptomyces sp. ME08-AFT2 TaxID=3028683 RepID=UPI0029A58D4D|nr:hypothetical protein [Streptomyces sp. ME08-AFT2]MDX3310078.1 hypothetical protein [Streptomyces sp. ME08-AFT2]